MPFIFRKKKKEKKKRSSCLAHGYIKGSKPNSSFKCFIKEYEISSQLDYPEASKSFKVKTQLNCTEQRETRAPRLPLEARRGGLFRVLPLTRACHAFVRARSPWQHFLAVLSPPPKSFHTTKIKVREFSCEQKSGYKSPLLQDEAFGCNFLFDVRLKTMVVAASRGFRLCHYLGGREPKANSDPQ